MKKSGVLKYILVVVAAVVVVLAVRLFAGGEYASYTVPPPAVTVAYPVRGTMTESLTLNGHVEARSMIPVIPLVSGTILDYPARSGESVAAGELLAQIDPEPFRQQMLQAQAAYTGYESSFRRVEGLYQAGAATRQEYDTLKSQRDAAKAQYDLAVPVIKGSNAVTILGRKNKYAVEASRCIRCGRCMDVCPMHLMPVLMYKAMFAGDVEEMKSVNLMDCIECGCCLYSCPANIPLLDIIRIAKGDVIRIIRGRGQR